ncbi:MAG: hypothetical protein BJ554DRAFT_5909 [Olpidium bornovanus]|uniref:Uncharacterized protein n=1 Tax=Olpidium bornovanus TaxID=278681 RepID=A0A8H7ZZ20_9FUNG|nr:MAG: hypothetical protein BJ554DRAFT_5909 [Olpidium bornovanus]
MALSAQFGIDSNMHPLFEGELDRYLFFGEPREHGSDGQQPLSVLSHPSPSAVTSEAITAAGADPPASASVRVIPSSYSVPEEYRDFIIPS